MESISRFQSELVSARERVATLQREAAAHRLLEQNRITTPWRTRLAAQLHGLADRLEPAPYTPKGEVA